MHIDVELRQNETMKTLVSVVPIEHGPGGGGGGGGLVQVEVSAFQTQRPDGHVVLVLNVSHGGGGGGGPGFLPVNPPDVHPFTP
eukprot:COSAG01_NODE_15907_length_1286_cov_7.721988_2_plen_84_part_00